MKPSRNALKSHQESKTATEYSIVMEVNGNNARLFKYMEWERSMRKATEAKGDNYRN